MMVTLFFGFLVLVFHGAAVASFGNSFYDRRRNYCLDQIVSVAMGYASLIYGGISLFAFHYSFTHWTF